MATARRGQDHTAHCHAARISPLVATAVAKPNGAREEGVCSQAKTSDAVGRQSLCQVRVSERKQCYTSADITEMTAEVLLA